MRCTLHKWFVALFAYSWTSLICGQTPTLGDSTVYRGVEASLPSATEVDTPLRAARNMVFTGLSKDGPLASQTRSALYEYPPTYDHAQTIPLSSAQAVIVGTVQKGSTHLAADATTIYSEFSVNVQSVVASTLPSSVLSGPSIDVVRAGGVVRMPSGQTLVRGCGQESLLGPHRTYLLLVKYVSTANVFIVVAGFEVSGQQLYMLDRIELGVGAPLLENVGLSYSALLQTISANASALSH